VVAGDPGLGKSLLTVSLAAKLTRGEIGDGPGTVLMLTAEDPLAQVVRPRLEAARANLERVRFATIDHGAFETSILLPDDVPALRRLVLEHEARLVVIDPLMAHLASQSNSWKDQTIREALSPVQRLADEAGAAVVVVAHLNKGQSNDPLQRLGGSMGIPAAARSVLLLGRDPDDPDGESGSRRVLAQVKSNLGLLAPSLLLEIETIQLATTVEAPRIRQIGFSPYGGSDLLTVERRTRGSKFAAAIALLEAELGDGPRPYAELFESATILGISESTLKRAKTSLGLQSERVGYGHGYWVWFLPNGQPHDEEEPSGR
jgi:hypothetical protein